jgi:hypothetical protein
MFRKELAQINLRKKREQKLTGGFIGLVKAL